MIEEDKGEEAIQGVLEDIQRGSKQFIEGVNRGVLGLGQRAGECLEGLGSGKEPGLAGGLGLEKGPLLVWKPKQIVRNLHISGHRGA